jgi:hypothetical protein
VTGDGLEGVLARRLGTSFHLVIVFSGVVGSVVDSVAAVPLYRLLMLLAPASVQFLPGGSSTLRGLFRCRVGFHFGNAGSAALRAGRRIFFCKTKVLDSARAVARAPAGGLQAREASFLTTMTRRGSRSPDLKDWEAEGPRDGCNIPSCSHYFGSMTEITTVELPGTMKLAASARTAAQSDDSVTAFRASGLSK